MCQNLEKLAGLFWNENATSKFKCDFFLKGICVKMYLAIQKNQAQGPVLSVADEVHADANNSRNLDVPLSRTLKSIQYKLILPLVSLRQHRAIKQRWYIALLLFHSFGPIFIKTIPNWFQSWACGWYFNEKYTTFRKRKAHCILTQRITITQLFKCVKLNSVFVNRCSKFRFYYLS